MKKISTLLILSCCLSFAGTALADTRLNSLQLKAAAFLLQQSEIQSVERQNEWQDSLCNDRPPAPSAGECVEFVAGSYPSSAARLQAARACAGVSNMECVQLVAGSYPSSSAREAAAKSCVGVTDNECVNFVAGSYPSSSARLEAAAACKFVSADCVKQVAGSYPSSSQRLEAAKACGGN